MMYILTPDDHAQIVDALDNGLPEVRQAALAMLKAMKPVAPSVWMDESGDIEDSHKNWMSNVWKPLYAKEQQ